MNRVRSSSREQLGSKALTFLVQTEFTFTFLRLYAEKRLEENMSRRLTRWVFGIRPKHFNEPGRAAFSDADRRS